MDDNAEWLEELKKYREDWERYTKHMNDFTHNFVKGNCTKCMHSYTDVSQGNYSWICQVEKAGATTEQQPKPLPNLYGSKYNLIGWPSLYENKGQKFKPPQIDPKKCDCSIEILMRKGCACGGT